MKVWSGTREEFERLPMTDYSGYDALVLDGHPYVWRAPGHVWGPLYEVLLAWDTRGGTT